MRKTCKKHECSRYQTKKRIILNKLVYPHTTNKCKQKIPPRWKTIIYKDSNNMNNIVFKIIKSINAINFKILKKEEIQLINKDNTNSKYFLKNIKKKPFHQLLFSNFCSDEIIRDITNNHTSLIRISFSFYLKNKETYYNNLFIFSSHKDLNHIELKFIKKVISRILFLNFYLDTNRLPNKIVLYYSHLKKTYPKKGSKFKINNVNSAVTDSVDIIIYRKEEMLKSIIHELVHFHKIDNINYSNKLIQTLINRHQISSLNPYYIRESITELLTTLFNTGYICYNNYNSIINTKNKKVSINILLNDYKSILLNEMIHNTIQVSKIIKNLLYCSFQEFCKLKNNNNNSILLEQESDVFSYYILKLYLLNQLPELTKNIGINYIIKFNNNHTNLVNKLFEKSRNDNELHKFINYLIKNSPNDKGMRMTAHILE